MAILVTWFVEIQWWPLNIVELPGPRGGLHFEIREAVSRSMSLQPERCRWKALEPFSLVGS